jgi:hypothetical protein
MGAYVLDIRQAADFRYDTAKEKLAGLELSIDDAPNIVFRTAGDDAMGEVMYGHAERASLGEKGTLLRLAGWIDLGSYLTVRFLPVIGPFANMFEDWMCWCHTQPYRQAEKYRIPAQRWSRTRGFSNTHN